jgi:hypothetical protein
VGWDSHLPNTRRMERTLKSDSEGGLGWSGRQHAPLGCEDMFAAGPGDGRAGGATTVRRCALDTESSEAMVRVSMIHLMLRGLATAQPPDSQRFRYVA